jgi:hypothetical protein
MLAVLLAAVCLLPGSASAVEFRTKTGSFGPDGTSATSFQWPTALAFDQGKKRLYTVDQEGHKIYGFNATTPGTHTPLGGSFPLEQPSIASFDDLAADSSSHHLFLANFSAGKLFGYDENAAALSGFPLSAVGSACGVAVDSSGNVWIATGFQHKIKKYSPTGTLLNTYTVAGFPCRLAFDSEDNLYTADFGGVTRKLSATSGYSASTQIDPEETYAITVDRSTDEVYVVHFGSVSVYEDDGTFLYKFGTGGEYYGEFGGIAIEEATDEVFLSDSSTLKVDIFGAVTVPKSTTEGADAITATGATLHGKVNPRGKTVEDCHFEAIPNAQFLASKYNNVTAAEKFPCVPAAGSIPVDSNLHAVSANVSGLDPAAIYHYRLVAKNSSGEVPGADRNFTSGAASPLIEEQVVEAVGTTDATLAAKINPRGGETTYYLEYGTTSAYGQSTPESVPFGFPSDHSAHAVSVHIGGLNPGTAYHFRFVAASPQGNDEGADVSFATYPTTNSFAPCPNDRYRTDAGSRLPDCRAYEQATPIDKHGANIQGSVNDVQASSAGDRVTFYLSGGLTTTGGSSNLAAFLASRGPAGWSSDGLLPATEPGRKATVVGWGDDLSTALTTAPGPGAVGDAFYVRDAATGASQLGPTSSITLESRLADVADADPSDLLFETEANLGLGASPGQNLYELDHGNLTLPGRIPVSPVTSCDDENGPACVPAPAGAFAGSYAWIQASTPSGGAELGYYTRHTISSDGSKVFFTTRNAAQLYVREDDTGTTRISASQRTVPDPNGDKPAAWVASTPDGSKAFFLSCQKLTDDSTAVSTAANSCYPGFNQSPQQGQDLYSYDTGTGELTDLTVDSNAGDPLGAAVQGVLGVSEDGSYVYFVANGVLSPDPGASPGDCTFSEGGQARCNLYVYHDGATKFIASLSGNNPEGSDSSSWRPKALPQPETSRVAADGSALLFSSFQNLTGYDNTEATAVACGNTTGFGDRCLEFYRYTAANGELNCVSCNPNGARPHGVADLVTDLGRGFTHSLPHATFLARNLSADGNRIFFDSTDALLPSDTNGLSDVYGWEAKGAGSCETESQDGGCMYLISSGTSPEPSYFADASKNGDHAFFFTSQQLVSGDRDALVDVYDAGVGGGLAAQHALTPPTCSSTACQANPPPPPDPPTASASFSGAGNAHKRPAARKCPQGKRKVRRAGKSRCVKASKHNKRHSNRGGSK